LKALCERYDAQSRPTYLTLYADLSDPGHLEVLHRRQRDISASLATAEQRAELDASMVRATAAYHKAKATPGAKSIAVFSGPNGFVEGYGLHAPIKTRLVLDSSPYVMPLARFVDDNEPFVLVLMDSERAAIFVVWAGKDDLRHQLKTSLIGRHKHGGMSQMRYQRHRKGQVNTFYDYVAEHLTKIMKEEEVARIVVAGPGTAKGDFVKRLPQALGAQVLAIEDADFKAAGPADDALVRRFVSLMRDEEAKRDLHWVDVLRRELQTGGLAATGPLECARHAAGGRVARLIVLRGSTSPGSKCEEHQEVFPRGHKCHCGAAGGDVDLVNEAVEFTVRSDGEWEFVEPPEPFLSGAGGVGAILRW
jgi:peptide chain release factor subunit 1